MYVRELSEHSRLERKTLVAVLEQTFGHYRTTSYSNSIFHLLRPTLSIKFTRIKLLMLV